MSAGVVKMSLSRVVSFSWKILYSNILCRKVLLAMALRTSLALHASLVRGIFQIRLPLIAGTVRFTRNYANKRYLKKLEHRPPPHPHHSPSFLYDQISDKFVNSMMVGGDKNLSIQIFRNALALVKETQLKKVTAGKAEETDPLKIFHAALDNLRPIMGTKRIRKGGKMYQVPVALSEDRQSFLAMKWLITASREKKGEPNERMYQKLAAEMLDTYYHKGAAMRQKLDLHKQVSANRTYASFVWT